MSSVEAFASSICPTTYPKFKNAVLGMLKEMDVVQASTPFKQQSMEFAKIMNKYGALPNDPSA